MSTTKKQHITTMRELSSEDEKFEAAGFVLDCILADAACDDPLGDSAALRPTLIARADDGSILAVICRVRPSDARGILGESSIEQQVLLTAP